MTENSDKQAALKPCAFCGSEAKHIERSNPMSKWRHSVDCCSTTCGMSGPVEATKAEAIEAWNRRPTSAGNSDEAILSEIAEMMSAHVENWPSPRRLRTAIKLIDKTLAEAINRRPTSAGQSEEVVELIARIIDPSSWRVMDGYLEDTKRKYRGQNVGWPSDQFQHKESMAKAREILSALDLPTSAGQSEEVVERAAKAIHAAHMETKGQLSAWTWEEASEDFYNRLARAALSALDLPTIQRDARREAMGFMREWMREAWPKVSDSDFNQGVVRGFEIIDAQIEHGHIANWMDARALKEGTGE